MIAREAKITFIKVSQSGSGGEVFGASHSKAMHLENKAEQVVLYQQVKAVLGSQRGQTHPLMTHLQKGFLLWL